MNFKQYFFKESPVWDDNNKNMGYREPLDKSTNTAEYDNAEFKRFTKVSKKFNEINVGDFTVVGYKNEDNYYIWSISKDGHIVGQLIVDIWNNDKFTPKANNMVVYKNYQRNGLSEAMYRMVIEDAGLLVSSNSLTGEDKQGGSFDVWRKLSTIYPYAYILQYYPKPATLKPVKTFERSDMKNSSQYFIVSKEPLSL